MGTVHRIADYQIMQVETSLGKVGRDSDGVVLRPALVKRVGDTKQGTVVNTFWKGRKPRRMGPTRVLEFTQKTGRD